MSAVCTGRAAGRRAASAAAFCIDIPDKSSSSSARLVEDDHEGSETVPAVPSFDDARPLDEDGGGELPFTAERESRRVALRSSAAAWSTS